MSIKKLVTLSLKATYTSCKWPASYFLLRFVCNVAYLFYSVNKRNNRKCITTVAGLPGSDAELKALVKTFTSVSTTHPSWTYVLCINVSCWLYDCSLIRSCRSFTAAATSRSQKSTARRSNFKAIIVQQFAKRLWSQGLLHSLSSNITVSNTVSNTVSKSHAFYKLLVLPLIQ